MAKFIFTLLFLFALTSGAAVFFPAVAQPGGDECSVVAVPGGCPDKAACLEVCRPCYRGVGKVSYGCIPPITGVIPYWQCRCSFSMGAPCPPLGLPKCPGNPPPRAAAANHTGLNQTLL